jgi:hypothetical protein
MIVKIEFDRYDPTFADVEQLAGCWDAAGVRWS